MKQHRYFLVKAVLDHGESRNIIESIPGVEYVEVHESTWTDITDGDE